MNRVLNLVLLLASVSCVNLFAASQKDTCKDDACGQPTAWQEFNVFELKMTSAGNSGYALWRGQFDKDSHDAQIKVETSDGKKLSTGKILVVGGRFMAVQGSITEPGYEIDALDGAVLELQLVIRLLGAALPKGPQEVLAARSIDFLNEKTGIQTSSPSAEAFIPPPWRVRGEVKTVSSNIIAYELTLTFATQPAEGGKQSLVRFSGRLSKATNARIDDNTSLDGWNVLGLGVHSRKEGNGTAIDYTAAPSAENYKTVVDIRKKIALDDYPGEPDPTKNFIGFWKENCEQAFGLQIMPYGTDGKYSVVFCGPGGCGQPGQEGSTTFVTKDPNYEVITENEIKIRGADGWTKYYKCTQDTHPVLKYKEHPEDARASLPRRSATESENNVSTGDKPSGAGLASPERDWNVIRSVPDGAGGTRYFVVIPETKQRNSKYYEAIGDALCDSNVQCSANFWTDATRIPQSAWMPVPDLAVMTASYERHPSYAKPHVHLACWLYSTKAIGESMQCEYYPGAKVPEER